MRNLGSEGDFKITVADNRGFVSHVEPLTLHLTSGATGSVAVDITVPAGTPEGTAVSLTATVVSSSNPGITNSATASLLVVATPPPLTAQLSGDAVTVNEGAGRLTVTVSLSVPAPGPLTIDYATSPDTTVNSCAVINNVASERCDFTTTLGTLHFAAGEQSRSFNIFIDDDAYVEGVETFTVNLSNPTGGIALGAPATTVITISDNDSASNATNPLDTPPFFVGMHYIDFLNREGEAAGVAAWVSALNTCPAGNPSCDRVGVSSAFFRSEEFQLKGNFVIRFYKVSLGGNPNYRDFTRDSQRVTGATAAEVFAARDAFTNEWVQRADFRAVYDGLSNQGYVDKLEQTAGIMLTNKAQLVTDLNTMTKTRAQVLREVVESTEVKSRMYNDAFVLMEYFGYLRRDPETTGYQAWLTYLNAHPKEFRTMINGFMNSPEYRLRFGQP